MTSHKRITRTDTSILSTNKCDVSLRTFFFLLFALCICTIYSFIYGMQLSFASEKVEQQCHVLYCYIIYQLHFEIIQIVYVTKKVH